MLLKKCALGVQASAQGLCFWIYLFAEEVSARQRSEITSY